MPTEQILSIIINKTQDIPLLLGGKRNTIANIRNLSQTMRLYNLSLTLLLPDGLDIDSSDIPYTSKQVNSNGITTVNWTNIKDLAPLEIDYYFNFKLKSKLYFKNGDPIPFNYPFSPINFSASTDTMPRGNLDIGNQKYSALTILAFKIVRYSASIKVPSKILKGAGTSLSNLDYTRSYITSCTISNNFKETSLVNISIILDDGIRYLGNISAEGSDAKLFLSPIIDVINIDGKPRIRLTYLNVSLKIESETTIYFTTAIWNRFNNNRGNLIIHGTTLTSNISIWGQNGTYTEDTSFSAMDVTIDKTVSSRVVDVNTSLNFSFTLKTGQYYELSNVILTDLLPDGIKYTGSTINPTSIVSDSTLKATVVSYNLGTKPINYSETITITSLIKPSYDFKMMNVVSGDVFNNKISVKALIEISELTISDSSNAYCSIQEPNIKKEFIKAYYRNGSPKNTNMLAPYDLVEYLLTYNSLDIEAIQKDIYFDDFLPLSINPINNLQYTYNGFIPSGLTPVLVEPHGVSFHLGDVPPHSNTTISFKASIASLGSLGENTNLLKMKGIDSNNYSYSRRDQVTVYIGSPNITLTKTVTGPNKNAIKNGEIYNYSVTVSNTSTLLTETDAFNFNLTDTLSNYFSLNLSSVVVSGSGLYSSPVITDNNITVELLKLSPGQSITLNYNVTIKNGIAPNISIVTDANTTNPYSQEFNADLNNYQYTGLNKSVSTTIKTSNITINQNTTSTLIKVGSNVIYTISVTIPQGTTAYNFILKDTLPNGQIYFGPAYKNNEEIVPSISSNTITFPEELILNASTQAITLVYTFTCNVIDATKVIGTITSTQTNTANLTWKTEFNSGTLKSLNKSLNITINHPNISMTLLGKVKDSISSFVDFLKTYSNTLLILKLSFINNSNITLKAGIIEIPLDTKYEFLSIINTFKGSAEYNSVDKKLILIIPELLSTETGFIEFTVKTSSNLRAGNEISTIAYAIQYKNEIASKLYSNETSNNFIANLPPGVTLLPNILYRINESTSYQVTPIGSTATIINNFVNSGFGIDDFILFIEPIDIDYSLYINNIKIADISKNTTFSISPNALRNVEPHSMRIISLIAYIPLDTPLDKIFTFIITITSNTAPNPSKTVKNIDPFFILNTFI